MDRQRAGIKLALSARLAIHGSVLRLSWHSTNCGIGVKKLFIHARVSSRDGFGAGFVCADRTMHIVASPTWHFFEKMPEYRSQGFRLTDSCEAEGVLVSTIMRELLAAEKV